MDENRQLAIIIDGKRYEKRAVKPEDVAKPCEKCALKEMCYASADGNVCTVFGLETQNDCNFQEVEETTEAPADDAVNHPAHYTSHPSGVECITITRHYCFSIGNAIKYLWRAGLKLDADKTEIQKEIEDLEKAVWYINDRIKQLTTND
jgi:hypothetical protein